MTPENAVVILMAYENAFDECPIGYITACILTNGGHVSKCKLSQVPFRYYLVTRWPVIDLLTSIWISRRQQHALIPHCDDLIHISLNWNNFRNLVLLAMQAGSRETWNEVLKQVDDIAWKSNSDAVAPSGETVRSLTNKCPYGVSLAALLRAWGIALHPDSDTIRIIEGLLQYAEHWMEHMEAALWTEWPIVTVMKLLRRARYYETTMLNNSEIDAHLTNHGDFIILVQFSLLDSDLAACIDHYRKIGLLDLVYIVPLNEESRLFCHEYLGDHCLPVIHTNPLVSKYRTLQLAFSLYPTVERVVFVSSTLRLTRALTLSDSSDLLVFKEKYSRNFDLSFLSFRNSASTVFWLDSILEWIDTYPFASERGGVLYLLQHSDPFVRAPQYSYLMVPSEIPLLTIKTVDREDHQSTIIATGCVADKYRDFVKTAFPSETESPPKEKGIVHVSFAWGCCERDQKLCGESATKVGGASVSIAMDDSNLSLAFKQSYSSILNFDRTGLMAGKTPSNTVGYYAWKPYVILTALTEYIGWDEVLVYTDAGVYFTSDMRPILEKYLAISDVVGANTVMLEAHATKRDAFVELEVDDPSAWFTNQIASCFIAVRKTPQSVELFRWWLASAGCETVIAETPNVFGKPNFDGFRFNNDDQVGFSLLSKKFGYTPMQNSEMLSFLSTARNLAKFIAAANNYALGRNETLAKEYMEAADLNLAEILRLS